MQIYIFNFLLQKILQVITVVILVFIILISPIFLNIKFIFQKNKREVFVIVKLFNLFSIIKCRIRIENTNILLFINKKFFKCVSLNKLLNMRKNIEPLKDYHIINFKILFSIGLKEQLYSGFFYSSLYSMLINTLYPIIKVKKPYLNFENYLNIDLDKNDLQVYLKTTVLLNLLMIFLSFIKILIGKIVLWKKKITE